MLTDEQIDYLLQIKETKPPLPERTVRVMLGALRWSSEEINHGINFLNRPAEKPKEKGPEEKTVLARAEPPAPVAVPPSVPPAPKPTVIKQNPFPLGSPLFKKQSYYRIEVRKRHRRMLLLGALAGLIVFILGLLAYVRYSIGL